jgi:hypothetical protein
MKVKELKELLNDYNDEDIVILQKDSEGNSYSPLDDAWEGKYKAETTWYGEAHIRELTPELIKHGYTEEDLCEDGENAIILCPIN